MWICGLQRGVMVSYVNEGENNSVYAGTIDGLDGSLFLF